MLGRSNRLVRRLRLLRRDGAARRAEGVLVAEGEHLVAEAIATRPGDVEVVVVAPRLAARPEGAALLASIDAAGVPVAHADDDLIAAVQQARSPQPVLAIVRHRAGTLARVVAGVAPGAPLVVLAGVQDPGNLGSIVRTADAAGAAGLVCCPPGADPTHPRAVRGTMGSIFRMPLAVAPVEETIDALRAAGVSLVATTAGAGRSCFATDWPERAAILLGGEGAGLAPHLRDAADVTVAVPLRDGVESLSVGAAAAVLLFDVARRRGA